MSERDTFGGTEDLEGSLEYHSDDKDKLIESLKNELEDYKKYSSSEIKELKERLKSLELGDEQRYMKHERKHDDKTYDNNQQRSEDEELERLIQTENKENLIEYLSNKYSHDSGKVIEHLFDIYEKQPEPVDMDSYEYDNYDGVAPGVGDKLWPLELILEIDSGNIDALKKKFELYSSWIGPDGKPVFCFDAIDIGDRIFGFLEHDQEFINKYVELLETKRNRVKDIWDEDVVRDIEDKIETLRKNY